MSDIPEDVMKAAWEVTGHHWSSDTGFRRAMARHVASAILAERERCATVADIDGAAFSDGSIFKGRARKIAALSASRIADAIRRGDPI